MELENGCYSERSSQRGALSCLHYHVARQRRSHGALCLTGLFIAASNERRMCSDMHTPAQLVGHLHDGAITVAGYQKALCHVSIDDIIALQLSERF